MPNSNTWPVLRTYSGDHLRRVAMPLGGVGTGTVSLGGRGDLRDWEIVNTPAKGFTPDKTFFAIRMQAKGEDAVTRVLEGPIPPEDFEAGFGCWQRNHTLPRFREARFETAYPLGQVVLTDPDAPLDVRLEAFNPFIPADTERSGLPVAVLRYVLTNKTDKPVAASVCGSITNFIGQDGSDGASGKNIHETQEIGGRNVSEFRGADGLAGLYMRTVGVARSARQWGTMALATTETDVTYRRTWLKEGWCGDIINFWDDLSEDGRLYDPEPTDVDEPVGSLCAVVEVGPGESRAVTFLLTWHFPNRMTWSPAPKAEGTEAADAGCCGGNGADCCAADPDRVGNYYTTRFADAWDAAIAVHDQLGELEADTVAFVRAFCESDMPDTIKEAALFNASILRTQTVFRTEDGRFYGFEGCGDKWGCCNGSCTHVWNYEYATAFLFGQFALCMREIEFLYATNDTGMMCFRTNLPLSRSLEHGLAAADGQMGCIMKLYRDWQLSGDTRFLKRAWPKARKALEFCWIPGGWDADKDGVMEGCQHNTMDVEYFGPNPEIGVWYLGALRAAEEMARAVGDMAFADECHGLWERGSAWMDENLFNGEFYIHEIRPIPNADDIAKGLRTDMGAKNLAEPDFQLGAACLVDQMVGQTMAHICGLGNLLNADHMKTALASIMKYNHRATMHGHFNHVRSYALGDDAGVLVATYPKGDRPKFPFPYAFEVWPGLEYTAAVHMLYEGMEEDGLRIIEDVRGRHNGRNRNPYNEVECGHHYARSMASWGAVPAYTGFHYSGTEGRVTFANAGKSATWFWSNGWAWGTCRQEPNGDAVELTLSVLFGELPLSSVEIAGVGRKEFDEARTVRRGESVEVTVG
jgi:non-lysosomal glucosylceramidase